MRELYLSGKYSICAVRRRLNATKPSDLLTYSALDVAHIHLCNVWRHSDAAQHKRFGTNASSCCLSTRIDFRRTRINDFTNFTDDCTGDEGVKFYMEKKFIATHTWLNHCIRPHAAWQYGGCRGCWPTAQWSVTPVKKTKPDLSLETLLRYIQMKLEAGAL